MSTHTPHPVISPARTACNQPHKAHLRLPQPVRHAARTPHQRTLATPTPARHSHVLPSPRLLPPTALSHHAQRRQRRGGAPTAAASASASASEHPAEPTAADITAEGDAAEAAPHVLAGRAVAVIGGGPGGMLCAAHLARLGAAVDVFESRDPEAVDEGAVPPAVWSIALSSIASRAVAAAGLNPDFGPRWRFEGSAALTAEAPPLYFGKWAKATPGAPAGQDIIALATQPGIVAHLTAECSRVYGDTVRVHYGMRAVGGDVCAGRVVLQDASGQCETREFDMVVGADGARSAVRKLVQELDSDFKARISESAMGIVCTNVTSPGHPSTYSTLDTTSGEPFRAVPEGFDGPMEGCAASFVRAAKGASPRVGLSVVAYRHNGAEVSFALLADAAWLRGQVADCGEAEIVATLADAYPHVPRLWLEEVAAFLHSKAADESLRVRAPLFVTCSKIASGRAILIGDAAHSVSPNLGMGCNAALQDSEVLSRACIAAAGDVEAAAQEYNTQRLEAVQVLTHVSERLDGATNFNFHRNVASVIVGLPYLIPQVVRAASRRMPVPGFLQPGFSTETMFRRSEDWTKIAGTVNAYTVKLLAFCTTAMAVLSTVVWKGVAMVTM